MVRSWPHKPLPFSHLGLSPLETISAITANGTGVSLPIYPMNSYQFLQEVHSIPVLANLVDHLSWLSGNFSWFKAWQLVQSLALPTPWSQLVWCVLGQPRICCMIWHLIHGKTPKYHWAKSRGVLLASRCPNCFSQEESDIHIFFECSFAKKVWMWLLSPVSASWRPASFLLSSIWNALSYGRDDFGRNKLLLSLPISSLLFGKLELTPYSTTVGQQWQEQKPFSQIISQTCIMLLLIKFEGNLTIQIWVFFRWDPPLYSVFFLVLLPFVL